LTLAKDREYHEIVTAMDRPEPEDYGCVQRETAFVWI